MKTDDFVRILNSHSIDHFFGVPDGLFKYLCFFQDDHTYCNITAANEGNAIGLACGYYLATKKIAAVYLQDSGFGNCINPLVSLADKMVYNIPLLMIIGLWDEPGIHDEPQHIKQGAVTSTLLEAIGIKYKVIDASSCENDITCALDYIKNQLQPFAFIIKNETIYKCPDTNNVDSFEISIEYAVKNIVDSLTSDNIIVSSTGLISRELYKYRELSNGLYNRDFLTVGSTGHSSSIAAAIAISKKHRTIICMEDNGSFLMHMGAAPVIAKLGLYNFKHIILNNESHDSVKDEAIASNVIDFKKLAISCGYKNSYLIEKENIMDNTIKTFIEDEGPSLLTINV
jgi:phosphonopyruvate decarboxylase